MKRRILKKKKNWRDRIRDKIKSVSDYINEMWKIINVK